MPQVGSDNHKASRAKAQAHLQWAARYARSGDNHKAICQQRPLVQVSVLCSDHTAIVSNNRNDPSTEFKFDDLDLDLGGTLGPGEAEGARGRSQSQANKRPKDDWLKEARVS